MARRIPAGQIIADALAKYDERLGINTMQEATEKLAELARSGDLAAIKLLNTYMAAAVKPEIASPVPMTIDLANMNNKIEQVNSVYRSMALGDISYEAGEKLISALNTGFNIDQMETIRKALADMKQTWELPGFLK